MLMISSRARRRVLPRQSLMIRMADTETFAEIFAEMVHTADAVVAMAAAANTAVLVVLAVLAVLAAAAAEAEEGEKEEEGCRGELRLLGGHARRHSKSANTSRVPMTWSRQGANEIFAEISAEMSAER